METEYTKQESETIRENCKRFREESGYTQQAVADLVEASIDTVKSWEKGSRSPGRPFLSKLAKLYGRKMDDFVNPNPPPPSEPSGPRFSLKTYGEADVDLRRKAESFLRNLNKEQMDRIAKAKKKQKH